MVEPSATACATGDMALEHPSWEANLCPPGEPIKGKTYRADGWAYQDFPRCSPDLWEKIMDVIGDENIAPLTFANYGHSVRGQLIISPTGMHRLEDWITHGSHP